MVPKQKGCGDFTSPHLFLFVPAESALAKPSAKHPGTEQGGTQEHDRRPDVRHYYPGVETSTGPVFPVVPESMSTTKMTAL